MATRFEAAVAAPMRREAKMSISPKLIVSGTPHERGRQHGEQAKDQVRGVVEFYVRLTHTLAAAPGAPRHGARKVRAAREKNGNFAHARAARAAHALRRPHPVRRERRVALPRTLDRPPRRARW